MSLRASIIINTYNRAPYLQRLLAGLGQLKGAEFEVIVVNGPSTDGTASLLEKYKGHIKIVDCPTRNLSRSRNIGIAVAAGDFIVFIDDDALPSEPNWLSAFFDVFQADENKTLGAAGGSVLHNDQNSREFDGGFTSEYGFQKFGNDIDALNKKTIGQWFIGVQGCNVAYRRNALIKIGGFDEFFVYYLDESDVCIRLSRNGYQTIYLKENSVRHYKSTFRINLRNVNWDIITQSDTYFALKNASDRFPAKLINTIRSASQKHFFKELQRALFDRRISIKDRFSLFSLWFIGFCRGLWAGMVRKRKLGDFQTPPPPFLPFLPNHVKDPLRVALISSTVPGQPGFGGIGRYTFDLARGLHQRGHEVHIICRDENPIHYESLGFIIHGISHAQVDAIPLDEPRPILKKNLAFSIAVEKKLAELYSQGIEFDVVHASNWDAEPVALIREQIYPLALMLVTPLAQVIQTEKWEVNNDLSACITLDRWQIEHADVVCVPSKGVLKSYLSLMDIHPEQLSSLEITPLGIVPENLPATIQPSNIRRLLFVGRLEWRKGAYALLEVLPSLLQNFLDWECHIVGNDQLPAVNGETFKQIFLRKHQGSAWLDRVIFHGMVSQDELLSHYQSCDLFVAPSLFESFGLIFQEAMQYGKPVVGCLTGGIPEVVEHGVEGLLVPPDHPEELYAALARLMQDDDLRIRMGHAAQERIILRDNYLSMSIRLEQVYRQVIQQKGSEYRARRQTLWK